MKVLVSPFQNPFINLALEDYLLRSDVNLPVLFFYINRPCVVMGRFQNPWLETNLSYLVHNDIWLVRRQSGGGCVYQDCGNLNFSFITSGPLIDKRKHAEVLQAVFKKADIHLEISPRNDLWLEGRKISGSAYKQTKTASYHHGTFLVSSDLNKLEDALKHTMVAKNTKSIASVRSKVTTIQEKHPGVEVRDVIDLVAHHFHTIPFELEGSLLSHPMVQGTFQHLRSWEWLWGETPLFEMDNGLQIRKGVVESTGKKFDRDSMKNDLTGGELEKLFPDFSEQHRLSSQIWEQTDS
jgi:lipoate-protein ligase A